MRYYELFENKIDTPVPEYFKDKVKPPVWDVATQTGDWRRLGYEPDLSAIAIEPLTKKGAEFWSQGTEWTYFPTVENRRRVYYISLRTVTDNIYFRSGATSDDYKFSELFVDKIKTRLQRSLLDIFAKNDIKMNNPTSKWIFSTKNPLYLSLIHI